MKTKILIVLTIILQIIIAEDIYSQSSISNNIVNIKGIDVAYEVHGEGKPIIMIHGFGLDREIMKGCMEPIFENREGWRRIYFDLPGMGQTPRANWVKNSKDMLNFVLLFIEQCIPKEQFILVGESYGGYLARAIIKDRAEQVDGMLLICPLAVPEMAKRDISPSPALFTDETLYNSLPMVDYMIFNSFATIQNKKNWERLKKEMLSGTEKGDGLFRAEIRKDENYGLPGKLDKLKVPFNKPCLFLTGRQDNLVGYRDIWKFIENYPRASFAVLDMAGHALQIEQEDLFNSLTNNWLIRLGN